MEINPGHAPAEAEAGFQHAFLSEREMLGYSGGGLPAAVWWGVVSVLISNWQDIREGFSDGVSGKPPRYKS